MMRSKLLSAKVGTTSQASPITCVMFEPHGCVRSLPLFLSSLSKACHMLLLKRVHGAYLTQSVCFTRHRGYGKTSAAFRGVESGKPLACAMFSDDVPVIPRMGVDFPSMRLTTRPPFGHITTHSRRAPCDPRRLRRYGCHQATMPPQSQALYVPDR